MPQGLDYVINLTVGDLSGAVNAKISIEAIDSAIKKTGESSSGLGDTINELGKSIAGAFIPTNVSEFAKMVVDFGKESLQVYQANQNAVAQVAQGIQSTSGVAGRSVADLREQAEALSHTTLFSDTQTEQAQAIELGFTNIRGKILDEAIPAIQNMATRMAGGGTADLKGASLELGKALNDPIKGIGDLEHAGVSFTDKQKDMIAQDVRHGEVQKAQTIILDELNTKFGGSAKAARDVLGPSADLNTQMEELKKGFGGLIDDGLRVAVPLIIDLGDYVGDLAGDLKTGYQWAKNNEDIFKALGLAVAGVGGAYLVTNANVILNAGVTAWDTAVTWLAVTATDTWTGAQTALNVALKDNPIGLIITAIGVVVGALYLAYERSETFRSILAGIGEVAAAQIPVFKGLGEMILGAFSFNGDMIAKGWSDAYDGIKKIAQHGGIIGLFNEGRNESLEESKHDAEVKAQTQKVVVKQDDKHTGNADTLLHHHDKHDKHKHDKHGHSGGGDDAHSASVSGGTSVRNVRVTIGKLVETIIVKNTTIGNLKNADIKRQITELLTQAVHDSELALGSQ